MGKENQPGGVEFDPPPANERIEAGGSENNGDRFDEPPHNERIEKSYDKEDNK